MKTLAATILTALTLTFSIGGVAIAHDADDRATDALIDQALQDLEATKGPNRGRVTIHDPQPVTPDSATAPKVATR